jgi:hypothetical protein
MADLRRIYRCESCGQSQATSLTAKVPRCHGPMKWLQTREYKPELHGWATGQRAPALDVRAMEIPVGDGREPVYATGLHDIRRIERESETLERDGMGQALRFRAFSQDRSNMHVNTCGTPPHKTPNLYRDGKQIISFNPIDDEAAADAEMGPGAREELASALGGLDE